MSKRLLEALQDGVWLLVLNQQDFCDLAEDVGHQDGGLARVNHLHKVFSALSLIHVRPGGHEKQVGLVFLLRSAGDEAVVALEVRLAGNGSGEPVLDVFQGDGRILRLGLLVGVLHGAEAVVGEVGVGDGIMDVVHI
jgi:hypothetical protein